MNKRIDVIIVTWNGMKWIKRCLDALRESSYPVRIIVIDNGSRDDTVSFVKENYREVHLVETGKNLGFGQANNVGMKYALEHGCDYVYLLNQDAYVYPDMFQLLIDEAEKSENKKRYAIYSPLHINHDVHKLDSQFKGYIGSIASTIVEDVFLGKVSNIYPVDGVPAAGWLLPRGVLEVIGGFDPIFFHYGEDHHYYHRVKYHGFATGIVPQAKMIHDRVDFGNSTMAKRDMVFRSLKTEIFLNINLSRADRIRKLANLFLLFSFESARHLLHGRFYEVKEFQKAFLLNLLHLRKYSKNRAINKQIGPNWLYQIEET